MQRDPFLPPGPYKARLTGAFLFNAPAGVVTVSDYTIPANRILNGSSFKCLSANFGDHVTFQIIVPVGHPANPTQGEIVANEFATNWFVSNDLEQIILYKATVYAGLQIRVRYSNTGGLDARFFMNLFLHEEVA